MNFKFSQKLSVSRSFLYSIFLTGLCYFFITWLRFHEWRPSCLWGDDLHSYVIFWGKHLRNNLEYLSFLQEDLKAPFEKVRFVFHAVTYSEFFLFKQHILLYFIFNVIIHSINGCLVCLLTFYFCRVFWASVVFGMCAVTAHFGLFEVTQITGHLESISLMFCLLSISSVIKAQKTEVTNCDLWISKWKWLALLLAFLAFNTHERYIVLLPWLALFFVLHCQAGSVLQRLIFASASSLLVFINIVVKNFVYHVKFFQGTGGAPLSINWISIKTLAAEGFFSILGLNHGPQYLAGIDWHQFPRIIQIAALLFAIASLSFISIALLPWRTKKSFTIAWPIYLIILLGLLLLPPILTVRIEQRWELAPFDLMLLLIACGFRKLSFNRLQHFIALLLIGLLVTGFIMEESYLTKGFSKIFLMYEQKAVEVVKHSIIDTRASSPGTPLLFVDYPGNCQWGLANGGLFLTYEGKKRDIFCVDQIKDIVITNYSPQIQIFLWKGRESLEEIILNKSLTL